MTPELFGQAVLAWFDRHGRTDLPWQHPITPYRVWVSEIMLQQTQVATVLGYFDRFMARFPKVSDLAVATEDEVLHLWTGLGYYSRARHLHRAARQIVEAYQGVFPDSVAALMTLPGVGRSTAGAIASIAFGIRAPILDGNVKRVLARYQALERPLVDAEAVRMLWSWAEHFTPNQRVNHYTQAMMDLGATVCTRARPQCGVCPLQTGCCAHRLGRVTDFPVPKPKKSLPQRRVVMPVFWDSAAGCVLLQRRPASGVWGNLWSLPERADADFSVLAHQHRLTLGAARPLAEVRHRFSHFQLQIEPWLIEVSSTGLAIAEAGWLWYNLSRPPRLGLAAPIKTLLTQVTPLGVSGGLL